MLAPTPATWTVRGATFALWALAAGSAAYWGLKLGGRTGIVTAPLPPAHQVVAVDPGAIARLLGSSPAAAAVPVAAAPSLASRFQLLGVAAGAHSGAGAAVISVDGKPARSFRVGSAIDEGLVLQSVHGRQATLGADRNGPPLLTLEVPPLKAGVSTVPAPGVTQPGPVIAPRPAFAVPPRAAIVPPQAAAIATPK
jgi:general secretion pathway protein C